MSRKLTDSHRLPSRSLQEIREGMEDVVTRGRRVHKLRVQDEPLSLVTASNAVLLWFLSQPESKRDEILLDYTQKLDDRLNSDVPLAIAVDLPSSNGYESSPPQEEPEKFHRGGLAILKGGRRVESHDRPAPKKSKPVRGS